ncbi:MAG TPA: hypothetical protein DIT13_04700 [Verrucomicrobiales bacterium]|nr:hypothetical protein [Verrucomicrobiales bacterium]HRJ09357.1 hypothetical protein [Prosthecobacter sp.]HRK15059.1 hypothetical protein [Prosthecobacter sp.]
MATNFQKHQLDVMAQAKRLCEDAGCLVKVERLGVLIIVMAEYGEKEAEQLFLEATEPRQDRGGEEGRRGGQG